MAGFQSADQLRRDATPNRMRTVMGPGGSGELETARRALWICCFHPEDSLDPVARTDNWDSPGEALTWAAVAAAIVEVAAWHLRPNTASRRWGPMRLAMRSR